MMLMWGFKGEFAPVSKEKVEEWLTNAIPEFLKTLSVKVYDMDWEIPNIEVKVKLV